MTLLLKETTVTMIFPRLYPKERFSLWATTEEYHLTVAELKSGIKEQKALAKCNGHKLRGVVGHLGGGHVADAEYLRIAVQATGSTTIHAENRIAGYNEENKCGYQVGELWFESEDGTVRALVLPMRWISADDSIGFTYK